MEGQEKRYGSDMEGQVELIALWDIAEEVCRS